MGRGRPTVDRRQIQWGIYKARWAHNSSDRSVLADIERRRSKKKEIKDVWLAHIASCEANTHTHTHTLAYLPSSHSLSRRSSLLLFEVDDDLYLLAPLSIDGAASLIARVGFGLDFPDFGKALALEVFGNAHGRRGGLAEGVDLDVVERVEDYARARLAGAREVLHGDFEHIVLRREFASASVD